MKLHGLTGFGSATTALSSKVFATSALKNDPWAAGKTVFNQSQPRSPTLVRFANRELLANHRPIARCFTCVEAALVCKNSERFGQR